MPRGFCGRSPHFCRLLPGDGEYSSTYRMVSLSIVLCAAGAAPTHHVDIFMAVEIANHLEHRRCNIQVKECGFLAYGLPPVKLLQYLLYLTYDMHNLY